MVNVALLLITRLKDRRLEEYCILKTYVKRAVSGGDILFLPALNFLFLLGLVEYHPKTDSVEYVGPNEAL
ncbi:MAG: hypothetical protein AMXMBFR4_30100 [Candidatus Hydrogenedentota bacterium]